MEGWIKIHRKITDWEWYDDANTFRLFLHLLLNANVADRKWHGQVIGRGQLLTSRKVLSQEIGISEQSVRTSMNRLNSTNEITIQPTKDGTLVTICKFEDYQSNDSQYQPSGQPSGQPTNNQQVTNNQPTSNQHNKNERKKEEKEKTFTKVNVKKKDAQNNFDFDVWWNAYAKKRSRVKALDKWRRLTQAERDECLKATPAYVASTPEVKFRKDPLTYLNGKCWEDEIIQPYGNNQPHQNRTTNGGFTVPTVSSERAMRQGDIASRIANKIANPQAGEDEEIIGFDE